MDFEPTLKAVAGDLSRVIDQLNKWSKLNDQIVTSTGKIKKSIQNDGKLGNGSTKMMDGALASFSNMDRAQFRDTRNFLQNGLGMFRNNNTGAVMATAAIGNASKIMGGVSSMMPDLGATFSRASGYYNAMVASGTRMNRGTLETQVQSAIGKGNQTGIGSDMEAASYLLGRGMTAGTASFSQALRTTGGVSQFMGMSNQSAAAAVEGFGSGAGSSNLLKNFGIYTSNPVSGKESTPQQIISQIKGRLTMGRGKYTTADVNSSLRKGALGVTLQNSGLSQDQQSMVIQSLLGDATDSKTGAINFDSRKSLENASKKQGGNPMSAAMKVFGSQNKAMQNAEGAYQTGADAAAGALSALNDAAGALASTFLGMVHSAGGTLMGNSAGAGAISALGGVANIAQAGMTYKNMALGNGASGGSGANGMLSAMSKSSNKFVNSAGKKLSSIGDFIKGPEDFSGKTGGISRMGKLGAAGAAVLGGAQLVGDATSGKGWGTKQFSTDAGSTVGGVVGSIAGSFLDPFLGPFGTILGGMAGSAIGGAIGGLMGSGGTDQAAQNSATGTTAAGGATQSGQNIGNNGRLSLVPPVNGPLGDRFGATASYRTHPHRGQDWSVSEGTLVRACADGKVIATNTSGELGRMVQIQHDGGYITQYCHLSNNSIVGVGDAVKQGQQVASSGNTGTATTGAHLHLALMKGGAYLDPMAYMGAAGAAPAANPTPTPDANSAAGGQSGATSATSQPIAHSSSNAVVTGTSGVSGTSAGIASQINGGATGGTGGGGEGTDPEANPMQPSQGIGHHVNKKSSGSSNNVTINLTIAQASEGEARHFAKRVKDILEEDNRLMSIGRL
ncbi:Peptidase M23 [uncultured Caudovirales phage]|uniref:Peptidase M23 n=1 Tax=uncultured Caudovirales phage TaxID=2100421 RepID=A0A6J5KNJ6_9CAUD|nr:Peptidase M23 [uncultured Caudovirales phage]